MVRFGCCMAGGQPSESFDTVFRIQLNFEKLLNNGFDFAEAAVGSIVGLSEKDYQRLCRAIEESDIKIPVFNCFIPSKIKLSGDTVNYQEIDEFLDKSMGRISKIGGKTIVFGSGGARSFPEGFSKGRAMEQIAYFLELCEKYAAKFDLKIAIEPLNKKECNMINTVSEAAVLVRDIDLPHIGLLADSYHMYTEGENPEILQEAQKYLLHVHLADRNRLYPGKVTDGVDFKNFLNVLKSIGYNKGISLECNFEDFERESRISIDYLKNVWESL